MSSIALAGNPNCGKTTLFNAFTNAKQHVGNWPGVTVEKKEGVVSFQGNKYVLVDLPGTYSLGAYSEDEIVARDYIIKENPSVVINVVDASNIERNLYLTIQMIEMGANVVIALNMIDEAKQKNIEIDIKALSEALGVPVIPTVASKAEGLSELIKTAVSVYDKPNTINVLNYGNELNQLISNVQSLLSPYNPKLEYPIEWIAVKLIENDAYISKAIQDQVDPQILQQIQELIDAYTEEVGFEPEISLVDRRYTHITDLLQNCMQKPELTMDTTSDKIDRIVTNKYFGIPIFAAIMFLLYELTFIVGAGMQDKLSEWFDLGGQWLSGQLEDMGANSFLVGFLNDGIIGGVGAVLTFVPLIAVMYFLIGLLEDSGYMARAAYVMDRLMRALGLHGKTFVSMIISTGCNVPGIMSTRTLDSKKDRMVAILVNPFISCGARLPIYVVFVAAFFSAYQGLILFSLYALGIVVALLFGKLFSSTIFKGEVSYFVMELPPYRLPSLKNVLLLMWEKASSFIKKAGRVILPFVIILWVLSIFPLSAEQYSDQTILGRIGGFVAPIFDPAGFGTWQASISLVCGIIAKETTVAVMGMAYSGVGEGTDLVSAIQQVFTPLSAMAFMVMSLLYTPCVATLAIIRKETNSWKWTIFSATYTFVVGYTAAILVYQIGGLLGFS
ncbi:ferrous iron transport protein B [Paenibacillus albiflavus]|uniref:Ferrous iron transport protein B n=1 Tax=Paenibacillus albiflavus TaxID=2545760 RepID=A0A4R4EG19_9BACL|nr:ferrous iron transport protein B [Paenibacillus albiflavus]TCZ78719.1 ferrous iron transport protein B [Paenibacillus albiflavus]